MLSWRMTSGPHDITHMAPKELNSVRTGIQMHMTVDP
jgi:hypothetical protein